MAVVDSTTLRTPEGVGYSLTLAGLGSRFAAGIIDLVLQVFLIILLVYMVRSPLDDGGGIGVAVLSVGVFVIFFGYQFLSESLFRGRTLGKRLTGLRVVNLQGGPVSVRQCAVRNIVRIVDILPTAYLIGMTSIAATANGQRVGDTAAGTVVIVEAKKTKTKRAGRGNQAKIDVGSSPRLDQVPNVSLTPEMLLELASWDVLAITRSDIGIVQQFLARRSSLDIMTRERIANEFAAKLRPRVQGVHPQISNERFLELLAEAKQIRR